MKTSIKAVFPSIFVFMIALGNQIGKQVQLNLPCLRDALTKNLIETKNAVVNWGKFTWAAS